MAPGLTQAPTPPIRRPGPPSSRPRPTRPALPSSPRRCCSLAGGLLPQGGAKGGGKGGTSSRDVAAPRAPSGLPPPPITHSECARGWQHGARFARHLRPWPCASLCSTFIPALREVLLREDNMAMVYILHIYKELVAVQRLLSQFSHAELGVRAPVGFVRVPRALAALGRIVCC